MSARSEQLPPRRRWQASRGPYGSTSSPRTACAFTLIELLIAISILGIGLTMAAALFPTAIKQNENSFADTLGMIICKNALATVKAKLTTSQIDPNWVNLTDIGPWVQLPATPLLTEPDLTYPVPRQPSAAFPTDWDLTFLRPVALRGAVVLAKKLDSLEVQLVIVSFAKRQSDYKVVPVNMNVTIPLIGTADFSSLTGDPALIKRGSPVIFSDGTFARIKAVPAAGQAILDRIVPPAFEGLQSVWVIVEKDSLGNVVGTTSPAMSVLVARTGLRN